MTDNDYLSLIEQGVEAWNRWREKHPEIKPDLSRAYLFEADLSGFNFSNVNFSRVCLIGANLKRANLSSADLSGAYASGANLSEANLKGADLSSANLSEANFTGADLTAAKVEATDLTAAQMTGACLESWQISKATKLHRIEAQYIYLNSPQKRFPSEGDFKPGELATLLQAESDRPSAFPSPPQKPVAPVWVSPQVPDSAESKSAPVASPFEATETAVLQSAAPGRSRSVPWEILVGVGVGLAVIAAIASFPRTRTVTELPPLVCNEPPLPPISDSPPDHEYEDGTRFYGTFGESAPADGRGTMVYLNGDRYDGEFRDGKRNGCGTFTFANRRSYVGQFRDDQFQGQGIWTLENGDRYIGEFKDNKCDGQGTFISVDGSQKTGIWENGDLTSDNLSCDRSPLRLPGSPE
jgi:hypothetical protein